MLFGNCMDPLHWLFLENTFHMVDREDKYTTCIVILSKSLHSKRLTYIFPNLWYNRTNVYSCQQTTRKRMSMREKWRYIIDQCVM